MGQRGSRRCKTGQGTMGNCLLIDTAKGDWPPGTMGRGGGGGEVHVLGPKIREKTRGDHEAVGCQ